MENSFKKNPVKGFEDVSEKEKEELYNYFLRKGENPEEIVKRALEFLYRKEEELKTRSQVKINY